MYRLHQTATKYASGKNTLIFFIAANVVYVAMLSITIPKTMSFSGGLKILDMLPMGYDAIYVETLFDALDVAGRNYYLFRQIPLDMLYPLLFTISYFLILAYLLKKLEKLDTALIYLSLLPLVAGLADYAENIGIIILLTNFPDFTNFQVAAASTFSLIKSISTTLYFVVLILVLIALGYNKLFRKKFT